MTLAASIKLRRGLPSSKDWKSPAAFHLSQQPIASSLHRQYLPGFGTYNQRRHQTAH
jgi:hypothetical protein